MTTLLDCFSGMGGASIGARQAGFDVVMGVDNDPFALHYFSKIHPDSDILEADIRAIRPASLPRTAVAWFSPPCTHHSFARGSGMDSREARASRDLMWEVQRIAKSRRFPSIVVENVPNVTNWPSWNAWNASLADLGYVVANLSLNAAHSSYAGPAAPQLRDRVFTVATRRRMDFGPILEPPAHCLHCGRDVATERSWSPRSRDIGRYGYAYVYRCRSCCTRVKPHEESARSIVDWELPTRPIRGDLAPRTQLKVESGLRAYGGEKFIVELRGGASMHRSIDSPLSSVTAGGRHHMLVIPGDVVHSRMLTLEEMAAAQRLDGLPTERRLALARGRVIGNAVPANVARDILSLILRGSTC